MISGNLFFRGQNALIAPSTKVPLTGLSSFFTKSLGFFYENFIFVRRIFMTLC